MIKVNGSGQTQPVILFKPIMKNVLITGGAGFIGSNLCAALLKKNYEVFVLDNLSEQIHGEAPEFTSPLYNSIVGKVNFIKADIRDRQQLEAVVRKVSIIVHFAAETGTGQSMYEIQHYNDVNIGGTALLLDILANKRHSVKKVVVASSRSIYGEGKYLSDELGIVYPGHRSDKDMSLGDFEVRFPGSSKLALLGTDEDSKIHPSSVYGITKQVQEQLIMTVCPTLNIKPVALRYQNVYGPGQSLSNPYTGILSIFSTSIKNGNGLNIFEDGRESRDFVFIDDVIAATLLCIENENANGEVFNVGTGEATDVLTVAKSLIDAYGLNVPVNITGKYRMGDIRHNFADIKKINSKLGFEPFVDFQSGIKRFTNWVNTQSINEDKYQYSIEEMGKKGLYK